MPVVRVPLFGSFTSRDATNSALFTTSQKDQYFSNASFSVVRNQLGGKVTVKVGPREEYAEFGTPSAASGIGTACRVWRAQGSATDTEVVTAFGSTNSTIYREDTSLGAITGLGVHISETMISAVPSILVVSASNKAYYYVDGGSLTEITDGDFPPKQGSPLTITGNFVHMDGFAFIMCTNGQIWHSDVNSLANWTSTASITAQEYPDIGVAIERYQNMIVGFSQYSIEFFRNAGNAAGSTLSRVQHMAKQIGLVNEFCVKPVFDTLAFIGQGLRSYGVYLLNNGNPEKISTEEIEVFLSGEEPDNFRLHVLADHGRPLLAVARDVNAKKVFVYDFDTRYWHPWTLTLGIRQSDGAGGGSVYVGEDSSEIVSSRNAGFSSAFVQTQPIDFGSYDWKPLHYIRVIGNKAASASNVTLSWSDDDGQTWSTGRTVNMAANDPRIDRCGMFKRRAFRVSGISSVSGREQLVEALELSYGPNP